MPAAMRINIEKLAKQWRAGVKPTKLAKQYGCSLGHIYRLKKRHKLKIKMKNTSCEPGAPTEFDDRLSANSLHFSPWVARRIAEIKKIR